MTTTMTQTEHLQLIRARCVELLKIAEKRTAGAWVAEANTVWADNFCRIADVSYYSNSDPDFIASCAGAAEAGWEVTIKAIDFIFQLPDFMEPIDSPFADEIRAAWPIELLNNK